MTIKINKPNNFFYLLFDGLIRFYQRLISPLIPARCRYYPTCSEYGRQALAWHGPWRGGVLAIKRICRCHPLGGHGIDFVPLPLYDYQFYYVDDSTPLFLSQIASSYVYLDSYYYPAHLKRWLRQAPSIN